MIESERDVWPSYQDTEHLLGLSREYSMCDPDHRAPSVLKERKSKQNVPSKSELGYPAVGGDLPEPRARQMALASRSGFASLRGHTRETEHSLANLGFGAE